MSTAPEIETPVDAPERNWLPMAIAAAVVLVVAGGLFLLLEHRSGQAKATAANGQPDAYAPSIAISGLAMSESSNLAGGKVTYVDGRVTNNGQRTVTGITVQVLFRSFAHEVAQNETQPLKLIRMREPYIDLGPVSAAPLKPGDGRDFRLIFDSVTPDWDGAYPEIHVLSVETR